MIRYECCGPSGLLLNFIFKIDESALDAIRNNSERIKIVSAERITDELNKIILSDIPSIGFKHLFNTGLLQHIFPQMVDLYGVDIIDGHGHKDNFYHTLQVLDNIAVTFLRSVAPLGGYSA